MATAETLPHPHPRHRPTRAEIDPHKDVIQRLDEDIIDIENEITKLQARLQSLQQRKANHASYIAPLRCLPPEILGTILYDCLYEGEKMTTLTQTCGTFRDTLIGMSVLWKSIILEPADGIKRPEFSTSFWYPIRCRGPEHLGVILSRAGDRPLRVTVECPPSPEMLKILSAHPCVIDTLTVDNENTPPESQIYYKDFKDLNFSSLRLLITKEVEVGAAMMIMDLALQSVHEVSLEIETGTVEDSFVQHNLIQKAKNLYLKAQVDESSIVPHTIPLQAPKVRLIGNQKFLYAFDFRNCESLELHGQNLDEDETPVDVAPTCFPERALRLYLWNMILVRTLIRPQTFVALRHLDLWYTNIQGRLGDYFTLPELRALSLGRVRFLSSAGGPLPSVHLARLFSDNIFLQRSPKLESISLEEMSIDSSFIEGLRYCRKLNWLSLFDCDIDDFIPPLLEALENNNPLPSLDFIEIDYSWSPVLNISFEEFRERVWATKDEVGVGGNGEQRLLMDSQAH
ncbi:hypothetical protein CPB86DRAFT_58311 [Serendipita vermifera]|nr:hypothetical protein CPB86DRAFT_58311 [Serendipita vermifera]